MSRTESVKSLEKKPKKNVFKKSARFFKDLRGELKKIVWPTRKQIINNTIVVCVIMIISAGFIFGIDTILGYLVNLLLR